MPIRQFDTKEAVPAELRDKSVETKDSKWIVDEPVDTEALKEEGRKALKAERDKAKAEKERADQLQADLDKLKTDKEATDAGVSAQKLQEIRDRELKPLQDENKTLKRRVADLEHSVNFTKTVEDLARKHKVMVEDEGRFEDFMATMTRRTKLAPDGKSYIVLDKAGNETTQTLEDLVSKTLPKEKSHLYQGPGGSGSGADNANGGGGSGDDDLAAAAARGKARGEQQKNAQSASSLAFK